MCDVAVAEVNDCRPNCDRSSIAALHDNIHIALNWRSITNGLLIALHMLPCSVCAASLKCILCWIALVSYNGLLFRLCVVYYHAVRVPEPPPPVHIRSVMRTWRSPFAPGHISLSHPASLHCMLVPILWGSCKRATQCRHALLDGDVCTFQRHHYGWPSPHHFPLCCVNEDTSVHTVWGHWMNSLSCSDLVTAWDHVIWGHSGAIIRAEEHCFP